MEEIEFGEQINITPPRKRNWGGGKKKKEEEKITGNIPVYVTDDEKRRFKEIYELFAPTLAKRGMSSFIKSTILALEKGQKRISSNSNDGKINDYVLEGVRILLGVVTKNLVSISNNYNQSIKRINSIPSSAKLLAEIKKNDFLFEELRLLIDKTYTLLDRINTFLDSIESNKKK